MRHLIFLTCTILAVLAQTPQQNCSKPIDIVFVLDDSGSIRSTDFTLEKNFVNSFADAFTFGDQFTKMGVIVFSTAARRQIAITADKNSFKTQVNAIRQTAGSTCIGCGIQFGRVELGANGRGVTSVMIVVTDGQNNINTGTFQAEIDAARARGIILVAVGVGTGISLPQLNQIGSTVGGTKLVYTSPNFSALAAFVDTLVSLVCVDIPVIPVQQCGNGIVEGTEQCDGGDCCDTATCTFQPATFTCRASAGDCDVAELCRGNNASCPADVVKAAGTPCGEFFGLCDIRLQKSCQGTNPRCFGPPAAPILHTSIAWEDFNVISFNGFKCHGGDVEGRLASKTSVDLQGFTLGMQLTRALDGDAPYSLFVAGDATWTDGSLLPNDITNDYVAEAYVGGAFTAPTYLTDRRSDAFTTAFANARFDEAQVYYSDNQNFLTALSTNVDYEIKYTNGLFLTCTAVTDVYHVKISDTDFNQIDWMTLSGCKFSARWIITITGTGAVTIKGQPFPAIVERVVYNIVGSGRTINGQTGVAGHILAPKNNYNQPTGVTYGKVIVGHVIEAKQNNKPNCKTFNSVTISTVVVKPVQLGETQIYVADLANFVVGDLICLPSGCRKLVGGMIADIDGDGIVDNVVEVDNAFPQAIAANAVLTVAVDPATADNRTPWGANPQLPPVTPGSSASKIVAALTLFALALF